MAIHGRAHGHVQEGWQETDEHIGYGFIKALRRGDYDQVLELAPTDERMADWPAGKRAEWKAWIRLTHRMKGQREHELRERRRAGRGLGPAGRGRA